FSRPRRSCSARHCPRPARGVRPALSPPCDAPAVCPGLARVLGLRGRSHPAFTEKVDHVLPTVGERRTAGLVDEYCPAGAGRGWVLDRSVGGLCLDLSAAFPEGTRLSLFPTQAPGMTPWTEVEVRSCRQKKDGYEVGCQFVKTPPWSILLLFG